MSGYPHHVVPDGTVLAPHHIYLGLIIGLIATAVVWDDERYQEPVALLTGLLLALYGFTLAWPEWPVFGSSATLGGLVLASTALVAAPFWRGRPWLRGDRVSVPTVRSVTLIGLLIAWDDAIEHALGWPTPLDIVWVRHVAPLLPGSPIPV